MTDKNLYLNLRADCNAIRSAQLRQDVDAIIDGARINADDTVYTEKTHDSWGAMFRGSLETILACNPHRKPVVAWFTRRGIRF